MKGKFEFHTNVFTFHLHPSSFILLTAIYHYSIDEHRLGMGLTGK